MRITNAIIISTMTSFMKVTYVKNGKTISSVIIFTVCQKSARVATTADHPATTGMGENVTIEKVSSFSFLRDPVFYLEV